MPVVPRTRFALKALQELGLKQITSYARYQSGLRSGYYQRATGNATQNALSPPSTLFVYPSFEVPGPEALSDTIGDEGIADLLTEANEITSGEVRLFGGPPVPLILKPFDPLAHWTDYESGKISPQITDIKWVWEPGRFGWAFTLGRAYLVSSNEIYAQTFWHNFETFQSANPPNMGPHWVSAQEVALRLMAFAFAAHVFCASPSSTQNRKTHLAKAIAVHAARIPPTLAYARAQNNNHLLSEAAGLITAGITLRDHPQAKNWLKLGKRWFNTAIQTQISNDGTFVQHSTNYHRLILQLALWVNSLTTTSESIKDSGSNNILGEGSRIRLAAATRWLCAILDPKSGRVPNLGPNDGAYIFPITILPFMDFRPVVQSASLAFHGEKTLQTGPWDEMALWYGLKNLNNEKSTSKYGNLTLGSTPSPSATCPHVLGDEKSWSYMRIANFKSRPGHADQLHVDLWWRGINIAQDAGTYLYNAPPPWNNSLTQTAAHNTITIDGADQMTNAGRFLWLDWAQATIIDFDKNADGSYNRLVAQHDGYRHIQLTHQRTLEQVNLGWIIQDDILPILSNNPAIHPPPLCEQFHEIRLHWLVPDWPWENAAQNDSGKHVLRLLSPYGWIKLEMALKKQATAKIDSKDLCLQIFRQGKPLFGTDQENPILGWVSPTYGYKHPALSICASIISQIPIALVSKWQFPR